MTPSMRFYTLDDPTRVIVTVPDKAVEFLGFSTFDWAEYAGCSIDDEDHHLIPYSHKIHPETVFLGPARVQDSPVDPRSHGHRVGAWMDKINGLVKKQWDISTYGKPSTGQEVV